MKDDEIKSICTGGLKLYAVDQSTEVYDWSVIFRLWKMFHNVVVRKAVFDDIKIPFDNVSDNYLLFCRTLCGYAAHTLNFELTENGRYIRKTDNIEMEITAHEQYIRVVLTGKERRSAVIEHEDDIPINPGTVYPDDSGFQYDGHLLSWPDDISEKTIDEFCGLFKTKESRGKKQSEEQRKYFYLKSLITQKQRSYPKPTQTAFLIFPTAAEPTSENRIVFKKTIDRVVSGIIKDNPDEEIIFSLPACGENEQKITEYAKEQGQRVSVIPLSMFNINSFRILQNILKLKKGRCLNCGGQLREYDNRMTCDKCTCLTLIRTICPEQDCRMEYYYLSYDVS